MKKKRWFKIILIISGFTIVFLIDDVLIGFLFGSLQLFTFSILTLSLLSFVVLIMNVSLAILAYNTLNRKKVTGAEGMTGKTGIALADFTSQGKIHVNGEIWTAVSHEKIKKTDKVRILEINGLLLTIVKVKT